MISPTHNVCKMCFNYPEIKVVSGVCRLEEQMEKLQNRSFLVVDWTRTCVKCKKI